MFTASPIVTAHTIMPGLWALYDWAPGYGVYSVSPGYSVYGNNWYDYDRSDAPGRGNSESRNDSN